MYVPRRLFFKLISTSSDVTLFSAVLLAPTLKRVVGYAQDIQCTLVHFYDRMNI
jgi:hypothetical protein